MSGVTVRFDYRDQTRSPAANDGIRRFYVVHGKPSCRVKEYPRYRVTVDGDEHLLVLGRYDEAGTFVEDVVVVCRPRATCTEAELWAAARERMFGMQSKRS